MIEFKRILKTYSKTILLTILIVLNIFTFLYWENEQYDDRKTYSDIMISELSKMKDMDKDERVEYLENANKNEELTLSLISFIKSTENENGITFYEENVMKFYNEHPDIVEQIKNKTIKEETERIKQIVYNKLLEQAKNIAGYDEYLDSIETKKQELLTFSIFNKKGTFNYKNIFKTAEDYKALKDINLEMGNYTAIEEFANYKYINIFLILSILIIVFSFLEDKKQGLKEIINTTKNGRIKLTVGRIVTLFVFCIISVLALYGSVLGVSLLMNGGVADLENIIISVSMFSGTTLNITIWEYLGLFITTKILSIFIIGLFIWYFFSKIKTRNLGFLATIIIFAIEYLLYTQIDFNNYMSILKVINIFPLIFLNDSLKKYININLFGNPVNFLTMIYIFIGICFITLILLHIFKSYYDKRQTFSLIEKIINKLRTISDFIINRFSLLMYEIYKIFILQKGWIILLVFIYIMSNYRFLGYNGGFASLQEQVANYYTKEFQGEIDSDIYTQIDTLKEKFEKVTEDFKEQEEKYKNGEINYYQYYSHKVDNDQATIHLSGLELLENNLNKLEERSDKENVKLWLIDNNPYENAYGENAKGKQNIALIIIGFILCLLLANSFSFEYENNTRMILNTTRNKKKVLKSKVISAFFIATSIWLFVTILELRQFLGTIETFTLFAPIQSLEMFSSFPLKINIVTYLCFLYFGRLVLMLLITSVILFISSKSNKSISAYAVSLFAILTIMLLICWINI